MRIWVRFLVLFIVVGTSVIGGDAFALSSKNLYELKCGRCHVAFEPSEFTAQEWPGIVRSMKAQAALTASETQEITEYLVNASQGEDSEHSGNRPSFGGYLYTEYFQSPKKIKNFDIHYLAFHISGWASDNISYFGEFELEHGGKGEDTFVEQAFLDWWVRPTTAVKIGAMLTPFNRFDEFHDPLMNYLITRPQVSRELGVSAWKEVGVDLHGYFNIADTGVLSYDLYTINGLGEGDNLRKSRQYRDNNESRAFGGRVNYVFKDMLEAGASMYQGAWDDEADYNLSMFGAHLMMQTPFAEIFGEYTQATSENPGDVGDGEMSGYFIQASRLFNGAYRPTVRYGMLDYLDEGDKRGRDSDNGNKDLTELALGLSYYPTSKVAFKFEYTIFTEGDRMEEVDNNQIGLQAAVKF
ncbi:MAG: hypothetical protein HN356_00375 [Calditrichaeota bacterium]|jgi:hypothetical protein|nr:hypothetical protein [Calditrichota bacterium]MBT7787628.1 hypothetical protein [Calditrichota bacterium]